MNIMVKNSIHGELNAERSLAGEDTVDFLPVVKHFAPDPVCTWLLRKLGPDDPDIARGLPAERGRAISV